MRDDGVKRKKIDEKEEGRKKKVSCGDWISLQETVDACSRWQ